MHPIVQESGLYFYLLIRARFIQQSSGYLFFVLGVVTKVALPV